MATHIHVKHLFFVLSEVSSTFLGKLFDHGDLFKNFLSHTPSPTGVLHPQTENHYDSEETAKVQCSAFSFRFVFVLSKKNSL